MRSIGEIVVENAQAVIREAEEQYRCKGRLTQAEAGELMKARAELQRMGIKAETSAEKDERRARWLRRKAESKARFWGSRA
jgi:hypothetical protein